MIPSRPSPFAALTRTTGAPRPFRQGGNIHVPAPPAELVGHVQHHQNGLLQSQHGGRQDQVPSQVGGIQDQEHRIRHTYLRHFPADEVVGDPLVFRPGSQAVGPRKVQEFQLLSAREPDDPMVPFNGHAWEIRCFLPEAGETVEEGGFTAVGRSYEGNKRTLGLHGRHPHLARPNHTPGEGVAHSVSRNRRNWVVSRRRAISLPSTRNTRGSPPGAALPATTVVPGMKPSSMRRRATSSGRFRESTTPDSPSTRSARVCGTRPSQRRPRLRRRRLRHPLPPNQPRDRIRKKT